MEKKGAVTQHNSETEEHLKNQTKKASIREAAVSSIMTGAGSNYISPYLVQIGTASPSLNTYAGLLTSVPSLLGNFSQIFGSRMIERVSRKKIIVIGALLQALMWLPMILIGYFFFYKNLNADTSSIMIIGVWTLLVIFGSFLSPAWNSLMKDVITKDTGRFFGKRNKIAGIVALGVMLIAGFVLNKFHQKEIFIGFCILFGVAFIARMASAFFLAKHHEPKLELHDGYYFTIRQFVQKIPESNFGKFSVFIALITLATSIGGPFFSVYLLKDLGFNPANWTIIVLASSLSSFLFMPLWGKFADKFGNLKVMRMTGLFIPLVPMAWLAPAIIPMGNTAIMIFFFISEFFSGFVWAVFNLSAVNFIYDAVTRQRIAICVAYYSLFNGIGVFLGATLGGFISSMNFNFLGLSPILFVFLLSSVSRLVVYLIMMPTIKEVREVEKYKNGDFRRMFIDKTIQLSSRLIRPRPTPNPILS